MRILVQSIGTRGDIEPMIAIAEVLSRFGHEVICSFPEKFRPFVEGASLTFLSLGHKYMKVLETTTAQKAIGGSMSGIRKSIAQLKFVKMHKDIEKDTIQRQYHAVQEAQPDLIVHNGITLYPTVWMMDHPGRTVLISAVPYSLHYVHDHPYILFNKYYGSFLNRLTYQVAAYIAAKGVQRAMKHSGFDRKISKKQIISAAFKLKTVYAISNALFHKPDYWPDSAAVTGFFERQQDMAAPREEEMMKFLNGHSKILFISMGSMVNPDPEKLTGTFLDILKDHQIPAIIATNAGGMMRPENYDTSLFYFTKSVPYHWIFPKVYGVIHHGGSGTVHTALKYGCASMAIPHFVDQFLWNKIIFQKKAGPKGIKISKIHRKTLEPRILDLFNNPLYKQNAERIAVRMKEESSEQELHDFIIGEKFQRS